MIIILYTKIVDCTVLDAQVLERLSKMEFAIIDHPFLCSLIDGNIKRNWNISFTVSFVFVKFVPMYKYNGIVVHHF